MKSYTRYNRKQTNRKTNLLNNYNIHINNRSMTVYRKHESWRHQWTTWIEYTASKASQPWQVKNITQQSFIYHCMTVFHSNTFSSVHNYAYPVGLCVRHTCRCTTNRMTVSFRACIILYKPQLNLLAYILTA